MTALSITIVVGILVALTTLAGLLVYFDRRDDDELPVGTDQFTRTAMDLGHPAELDLDPPAFVWPDK